MEEVERDSGLTAEQRGWVVSDEAAERITEDKAVKGLATVKERYMINALANRGVSIPDIAANLHLSIGAVNAILGISDRRVVKESGATDERIKQLKQTNGLLNRLATLIWREPDKDTQKIPPPDRQAVETYLKVLTRRAALTGADMPSKMAIEAEVTHKPAAELVDAVNEYMDLADELLNAGYGSGRAPEGGFVIDATSRDPRELPPPEPPQSPFKKADPAAYADFVTQAAGGGGDQEAVVIELDPIARALRLPDPDPDRAINRPTWSVTEDDG